MGYHLKHQRRKENIENRCINYFLAHILKDGLPRADKNEA